MDEHSRRLQLVAKTLDIADSLEAALGEWDI